MIYLCVIVVLAASAPAARSKKIKGELN